MKYKLDRLDMELDENVIYLLPTSMITVNNPIYINKNFSIEFHFLIFHARFLFIKEEYKY